MDTDEEASNGEPATKVPKLDGDSTVENDIPPGMSKSQFKKLKKKELWEEKKKTRR